MGLQTPTLWGFPSLEIGEDDGLVIIVRDRAQEDKVVKVIEPQDTVYLTYNWEDEGRLAYIRTEYPNYKSIGAISQLHKLYYEDYLTSYGAVESVLGKVRQVSKLVKKHMENVKITSLNTESDRIYDSIYKEITEMNAKPKEE